MADYTAFFAMPKAVLLDDVVQGGEVQHNDGVFGIKGILEFRSYLMLICLCIYKQEI